MGLFATTNALERIEDRLRRIEDIQSDLQRESKKLDLEFTDLYDKVRRQMSRMAKRYAVDQKENGELVDPPEPDDGMDPISRSIMLRRGMGRLKL